MEEDGVRWGVTLERVMRCENYDFRFMSHPPKNRQKCGRISLDDPQLVLFDLSSF